MDEHLSSVDLDIEPGKSGWRENLPINESMEKSKKNEKQEEELRAKNHSPSRKRIRRSRSVPRTDFSQSVLWKNYRRAESDEIDLE